MNILLVGNYIPDEQESMLLFSKLLLNNIKEKNIQVEVWHPKSIFGNVKSTLFSKYLAYIDKFIIGSLSLLFKQMFNQYDIYHIVDHSNAMYINVLPKNKTVITCHDCIAIEEALHGRTGEKVGRFAKYLQKTILNGLKKAKVIVSVSNATKKDIKRLAQVEDYKIKLIYNCSYTNLKKMSIIEANKVFQVFNLPTDEKFIFSLGNNLIRKNRKRIIEAYIKYKEENSTSKLKLWIAGKEFNDEIDSLVMNSKCFKDIRFLGRVDDELLNALYIKCDIFAFPSLDEGFGVPIIEAQMCNALVITSNKEPMSEVGGKAAILVDPYSVDSLANALNNYKRYSNFEEKIEENVKKFSKENMINNYIEIYKGL